MKKFIEEFKSFIARGNVFDLAVGIIIGGAFGKIVTSFVNDLFMPIAGLILGRLNLAHLKIVLSAAKGDKPELAITYGNFIQTAIDFLIVSFIVFLMIKVINSFRRKEEKPEVPPEPSNEEKLLAEIRDLLKEGKY